VPRGAAGVSEQPLRTASSAPDLVPGRPGRPACRNVPRRRARPSRTLCRRCSRKTRPLRRASAARSSGWARCPDAWLDNKSRPFSSGCSKTCSTPEHAGRTWFRAAVDLLAIAAGCNPRGSIKAPSGLGLTAGVHACSRAKCRAPMLFTSEPGIFAELASISSTRSAGVSDSAYFIKSIELRPTFDLFSRCT
jgi:hypothetical protein